MDAYTREELENALAAVRSLIRKCEKFREKLPQGKAQRTLLENRIKAFRISESLILEAMGT